MENANVKEMNLNEANENMENKIQETATPVEVKKKGFLTKLRALKWWQKAMIFAGTAALIYVGGKWVFKAFKTPEIPEVTDEVKELAEAVVETATESVEEVAPF